jgi:hypothetical protein
MLTNDRKRLVIFEKGISTNQTLLKHTDKIKRSIGGNSYSGIEFTTSDDFNIGFNLGGGKNTIHRDARIDLWDGLDFPVKTSFKNKTHENLYKMYLKTRRYLSKSKIPPSEFFNKLKDNVSEFSKLEEHIEYITKQIDIVTKSGQIDTSIRFREKLGLLESEVIIRDGGFKHYVSEENLVKFVLKSVRGLKLDYILKYDRLIPEDVVTSKDKAEQLRVFDNYIILHYDPDSAKLLQKEVQASEEKKDPILFGLIKGSNKLYFIDDWIDEHCDLTFSKLIEAIGQDSILE